MAYATLNGAPVLEAQVQIPRLGAWHATLRVDADAIPTGRASLVVGGVALSGTARPAASGMVHGTAYVFLVGGAGRLRDTLPPAAYRNTPLSVPIRDVLSVVGESLAPESDAAALATNLSAWTRTAGTAGRALWALAARAGVGWRVLPSGKVWLGKEAWRPAGGAYEVLEEQAHARTATLFSEAPSILPGNTLFGRPVAHVAHVVTPEYARVVVTFEDT